MPNAKISDPLVFITGATEPLYNDITKINGLAGWSNETGVNQNVAISGTQLVISLEQNLKTPVDSMICLNYPMPNIGFVGGDWNAPSSGSWIKNNTILDKYDKTSTNNRLTLQSLANNTNFFFDLEISLSGQTANGGLFNWEVRMVDPSNPANVLTLMDSAGVYPQIQTDNFETGAPNNWGYGWKSETTPSSINIKTNFFDAFGVTEAEIITTISTNNAGDDYANVGAWLRVRSE